MMVSNADLRSITNSIWSTQLGLNLEMVDIDGSEGSDRLVGGRESSLAEETSMTGSIQISGTWKGAVHLQCTYRLARRAAALMFGLEEGKLNHDDVLDALGELTNMTAGNLKSLLPGESYMSLPTVVDGTDYDVTLLDSELVMEVAFVLDDEPLGVRVFKSREAGPRGSNRG